VANEGEDLLAFQLDKSIAHVTFGDLSQVGNFVFLDVRLQILKQVDILDALFLHFVTEVSLDSLDVFCDLVDLQFIAIRFASGENVHVDFTSCGVGSRLL